MAGSSPGTFPCILWVPPVLLESLVLRRILPLLATLALTRFAAAQQPPPQPPPKVQVNMLNVCAPSPDEQKEIAAALARIPRQPLFTEDFEVDRGRSTWNSLPDFSSPAPTRRCLPPPTLRVGFAFATSSRCKRNSPRCSTPSAWTGRTWWKPLVFHVREPKDLMEIADRRQRFVRHFSPRSC